MTRLQVESLSFSYPCGRMLHDITFHVNQGEFVGLILVPTAAANPRC